MRKLAGLLLVTLAGSLHLSAQSSDWRLDKAHSKITFSDAAAEGTISVGSINTDNERRDNHLMEQGPRDGRAHRGGERQHHDESGIRPVASVVSPTE